MAKVQSKENQSDKGLRNLFDLYKRLEELTQVGAWEYDLFSQQVTWTEGVYRIYGLDTDQYNPKDPNKNMEFFTLKSQSRIRKAFWHTVLIYSLNLTSDIGLGKLPKRFSTSSTCGCIGKSTCFPVLL